MRLDEIERNTRDSHPERLECRHGWFQNSVLVWPVVFLAMWQLLKMVAHPGAAPGDASFQTSRVRWLPHAR